MQSFRIPAVKFLTLFSPKVVFSNTSRAMTSLSQYNFETLKVSSPKEFVYHVEINRPEKRNAMNLPFWKPHSEHGKPTKDEPCDLGHEAGMEQNWPVPLLQDLDQLFSNLLMLVSDCTMWSQREMVICFEKISSDPDCRSVVFSGAGKMFTAGIDVQSLSSGILQSESDDVARKAMHTHSVISKFQESFTALEKCPKPVIVAVHNGCIGGGVDLICAADIRYCTQDAWFQVKEVDLGIVADVGTLQRFPKIVGNDSLVRELCYTARQMKAEEAKDIGLVSRIFPDHESVLAGALETASVIASKSPVAVQGTKMALIYARDHSVSESLKHGALLNQAFLQSEDVVKAVGAMMTKETPVFSKL